MRSTPVVPVFPVVPAILATVLSVLPAFRLSAQSPTVFEHVNVIPMDRERVLEDQTVVVQDGRIASVGPAGTVSVPAGAIHIAARGKYLIPGLAEMHAHIPAPSAAEQMGPEFTKHLLFLYVAAGVTTVRGMLGHPSHLDLRRRVEAGDLIGPRIWTSGPSVNGTSVSTPDSAVRAAAYQRAAGFDFIKIHPGLTREVFDSLDAAADRLGLRFAGHVPVAVGLPRALEAGYWTIDHLDGYLEELAGRGGQDGGGWFGAAFANSVDAGRIPALAHRTRDAGVWTVPTQTLMDSYATAETADQLAQRSEVRFIPPRMRQQWRAWKLNADSTRPGRETLDRWIAMRRVLIKALHDAGAGLLLGSDAPQVWNVPGFSIHRELEALVAAGLTPYQALETGTRNVATHLGVADRSGTIGAGMQADLVLLDGNPLADIRQTSRRAGVMIRGAWLPQEQIQQRLEVIASGYSQ
jgi:imidazolonepropionase-like amidohydrolase